MKVGIIASLAQPHECYGFDNIIGCDYGAFVCAQAGLRMSIAVGDFDSVTSEQLALIHHYADEVHTLSKDKDVSDTEYALSLTSVEDEVLIVGGLGQRLDHEWANVLSLFKYPHAKLINNQHIIFVVNGQTTIKKEKTYCSIFPVTETIISMSGVKYPLKDHRLRALDTLCLSNEIIHDEAIIKVNQPVLVILSQ